MAVSIISRIPEKSPWVGLSGLNPLEVKGWLLALTGWIPDRSGFVRGRSILTLLSKSVHGVCWIQLRVTIVHRGKLSVGNFFGVNSETYINAIGGITMGPHVLNGSNVTTSSGRHPIEGAHPPVFDRETKPLPITLDDEVWIAAGAGITPGITLCKGPVVGANALGTKGTDEYAVVVGAPTRTATKRVAA